MTVLWISELFVYSFLILKRKLSFSFVTVSGANFWCSVTFALYMLQKRNPRPYQKEFSERVQRVCISIRDVSLFRCVFIKPVFPLFLVSGDLQVHSKTVIVNLLTPDSAKSKFKVFSKITNSTTVNYCFSMNGQTLGF